MSQKNPKYERLESLLSEARPADPDPATRRLENSEVEALKDKVVSLQAELEENRTKPRNKTISSEPIAMTFEAKPILPEEANEKQAGERKARNAFLITIAVAAAHFVAVVYYLYLGWTTGTAQLYELAAISFALGVLSGIGALLSKRGQPTQGLILILGALSVSYPPVAATLVSGLGTVLGLALMGIGPMSAFQVLPKRSGRVMTVLTIVAGLATLLLDVFGSTARPPLPGIVIQLLAVSVVGMLGYSIVRQFRDYPLRTKLVLGFLGVLVLAGIVDALAIREQFNAAEQTAVGEAGHVAETLGVVVARNQVELQELIGQLHETQQREVRVLDLDQRILASAIPGSIGTIYDADQTDEVASTLEDGQPRAFLETSAEFPQGIKQVVVPIRDESTEKVIGAVMLDYTEVLQQTSFAEAQNLTTEINSILASNPASLQSFISILFNARHQDMVVVDLQKRIVADSSPENSAAIYTRDLGGEVSAVLQDGQQRAFSEISVDHPRGIQQVVTPLKDLSGQIIGATILGTNLETEQAAISQAAQIAEVISAEVSQNQARLQELIAQISETQKRDVEVVGADLRVLADSAPEDNGTIIQHDQNGEVAATLKDGQSRTFVEVSEEYPQGIKQVVVPTKDESGKIVSVVILDYTSLYDEVQQSANNAARLLIFLGTGGLLLAFAISQVISASIATPISQLSNAAQKIGSGELNTPIPLLSSNKDEVGILASAFRNMTAQLRGLIGSLEQRVAERTQELETAAEVVRAVSEKTADIYGMLNDAVHLISERFHLYYVQIYLADTAGRTLTLRAGSGEVGAELLRRGHSLPLDSTSINGRAAAERVTVIVSDTAQSANFRPNPILPNTRSEAAIPLIVGGKVVGVLDLQSAFIGALSETNLTAFEALSGQLAIALQNAALFAQAEQSRAEMEAQARRLTRTGWAEYLNAIQRPERTGYIFDQNKMIPIDEAEASRTPNDNVLTTPIAIIGESVGTFSVELEGQDWDTGTKEFINTVARQMAQQIENLRLLETAQQYRSEAENVARRLTREGWETFLQTRSDLTTGFIYDQNNVHALENGKNNGYFASAITKQFVVRNETIGELAVNIGDKPAEDMNDLITAVAEQLGSHIENLRLSEENEMRAAELEKLVTQLRELDRLKSSFLANMSHELRTPLNSILGFADVMLEGLDGPLTDNMNNDLGLIQKNGQHLLHLINDVLDMAKIDSGKMNFNIEKFNVHELLTDVASITSPLANEKSLALIVEPDSDRELEINADKIRLRQVMINLVNNAMKFTEKGRISIRVIRENKNVLISVKDTGIGISKDNLEAVFQEFTQLDTTTTRKAGGTGLGLPISRRLINMHSGRLWAESTGIDGEGSTLFVTLPIEANINEDATLTAK